MTTTDLIFTAPTLPVSSNATKGGHWATVRAHLRPWNLAAYATAHNYRVQLGKGRHAKVGGRLVTVPTPFIQVPITVQVYIPFRSTRTRDPHNYVGTNVKAIVDGIVKAGIVPDDNPRWVTVLEPVLVVIAKPQPLTVVVQIRPREETP